MGCDKSVVYFYVDDPYHNKPRGVSTVHVQPWGI